MVSGGPDIFGAAALGGAEEGCTKGEYLCRQTAPVASRRRLARIGQPPEGFLFGCFRKFSLLCWPEQTLHALEKGCGGCEAVAICADYGAST